MIKRLLLSLTILLASIFALVSCNVSDEELVSNIPKPIYNDKPMSSTQVRESLNFEKWVSYSRVLLFDRKYIGVTSEHLKKYNKWFTSLTFHMGIDHKDDAYDCDNFAFLYKSILTVSSYKNWDVDTEYKDRQVLAGTLIVYQTRPFGGVRASNNTKHALNIVYVDNGWVVVEPQTGKMIEYEKYPNRDRIIKIIF